MKFKIKLFFVFCMPLFLLSCKLEHTLFFRNFSSATVKIIFQDDLSNGIGPKEFFYFKNEILKINKHTTERLSDTLHFTRIEPQYVSITVPPHSTVCINPLNYDLNEVRIAKSGSDTNSNTYTVVKKFNSLEVPFTGGILGLLRPYGYYDYKE